jgi:hypothetical protein
VRDTTRDEDVRIVLVSIFASAFCVALGNPGVLVHRRSPGLANPLECPSAGKVYWFKGSLFTARGKGIQKVPKGEGVAAVHRSRASGHVARRNFQGNRRGDGTSERHAASE